jgi:hypothetical protein
VAGECSGITLVWVNTFEMGEHHVSVKLVAMLDPSMLDHGVCDAVLVDTDEVAPAARARLLVRHRRHPMGANPGPRYCAHPMNLLVAAMMLATLFGPRRPGSGWPDPCTPITERASRASRACSWSS